jgi:hypothetical protein
MRRTFTVLLGLRDRPQLHAPDSDPFRALSVWAKSNRASLFMRVKSWEIIADNLSKNGWSYGCVSKIVLTIWPDFSRLGVAKRI